MRKIIATILILLISINLFACHNKKVEETSNTYSFEYKFKEFYSDKIDPLLAATFIDLIEATVTIYNSAFDDFIITEFEKDFDQYTEEIFMYYVGIKDTLNEHEKELFEVITGLNFSSSYLSILKLQYKEDEIKESIGIKAEHPKEYYDEQLIEKKKAIESNLERAMKFID